MKGNDARIQLYLRHRKIPQFAALAAADTFEVLSVQYPSQASGGGYYFYFRVADVDSILSKGLHASDVKGDNSNGQSSEAADADAAWWSGRTFCVYHRNINHVGPVVLWRSGGSSADLKGSGHGRYNGDAVYGSVRGFKAFRAGDEIVLLSKHASDCTGAITACPLGWKPIGSQCYSAPRFTTQFATGCIPGNCQAIYDLCSSGSAGGHVATREELEAWVKVWREEATPTTHGITSTRNEGDHWLVAKDGGGVTGQWHSDGCCGNADRYFVCVTPGTITSTVAVGIEAFKDGNDATKPSAPASLCQFHSCVAHYPLAGDARDASGNGNHAEALGKVEYVGTGQGGPSRLVAAAFSETGGCRTKYHCTFLATGCLNKEPQPRYQNSDSETLADMHAYCVLTRAGTANQDQLDQCCGVGELCYPACEQQTEWTMPTTIPTSIKVAHAARLQDHPEWTFACWFKCTGPASKCRWVYHEQSEREAFQNDHKNTLELHADNPFDNYPPGGTPAATLFSSVTDDASLNDHHRSNQSWHHATWTKTRTMISFYLDGGLVSTKPFEPFGRTDSPDDSLHGLIGGVRAFSSEVLFVGLLADVYIFHAALPARGIVELAEHNGFNVEKCAHEGGTCKCLNGRAAFRTRFREEISGGDGGGGWKSRRW